VFFLSMSDNTAAAKGEIANLAMANLLIIADGLAGRGRQLRRRGKLGGIAPEALDEG
jgi:hypothetical protein